MLSPIIDITEYYLPLDLSQVFGDNKDSALEIGSGDGSFLIEMAKNKADWNFIGIEIKGTRIKKAVKRAEMEKVKNVKFLQMDARIAVEEVFKPNLLSIVYINFPDPWPKDRHKKHRIINNLFLTRLSKIMKYKASLEIVSDHKDYIDQILSVFNEIGYFKNLLSPDSHTSSVSNRPLTKYESEYNKQGRVIYYLSLFKENTDPL